MKAFRASDRARILGLHSLGFLVVTLAAYLSSAVTMSYAMNRFSTVKVTVLIGLAVVYLLNLRICLGQESGLDKTIGHLRRNSDRHRRVHTLPGNVASDHVCDAADCWTSRGAPAAAPDVLSLRHNAVGACCSAVDLRWMAPGICPGSFLFGGDCFCRRDYGTRS